MPKQIRIEFDYLHGPLWKDKLDLNTGHWYTGIEKIDNDETLQSLNDEAEKMYESLYSFDGRYKFDDNKYSEIKDQLLSIVQTIKDRLSLLNDGSFEIVDNATKQLM